VLLSGDLVALPTETVYGLAGLADEAASVARIYAAKGRPAANPLIAHAADAAGAKALAAHWPAAAEALAAAFWPGPLTLVVPRAPHLPAALSAGLDTVALRVPDHPVAGALLALLGRPLAAPSANPAGRLSPTLAEHVVRGLGSRVALVLDAGPTPLGIESSVVDVSVEPARLLRPGSLSLGRLREVWPAIVAAGRTADDGPAASPGLGASHYAPRARLHILDAAEWSAQAARTGAPAGAALLRLGDVCHAQGNERALPREPEAYAAGLYAALHLLDVAGIEDIFVEAPPPEPEWDAVRDRLARAAAPRPDRG
jgi:L-threonylcarbamoyladenylate synthase